MRWNRQLPAKLCLGLAGSAAKRGAVAGLALFAIFFILRASAAQADNAWNSTGIGGNSLDTVFTYNSVAFSPFGQLHEPGLIVRGTAKTQVVKYNYEIIDGVPIVNEGMGFGAEAEAGWQFIGENWRASVFGGIAWRDFELLFEDHKTKHLNTHWAATLSVEGEFVLNEFITFSGNARYAAGFDEAWASVKAITPLWIGPSAGISVARGHADRYSYVRAGPLVTGWEIFVPKVGLYYLTVEAGVQYDLRYKKLSPYAGVHSGISLN